MRFDTARRRLTQLPNPLPPPPAILQPIVLAGPEGRPRGGRPPYSGPTRESAVLVLVYPDPAGDARVVLTERPTGDLRHAGEISFPGGALDPGDASPEAAALREAQEEVALDTDQAEVAIVGRLEAVVISVSGFRLLPVLALAVREPALVADAREVAAILRVPLARFLPDAPTVTRELQASGWRLRFGAYDVDGAVIWGATARILGQLGAIVSVDGRA